MVAGVQKTFSRASIWNTQWVSPFTPRVYCPAAACLDSARKTRFIA